MPNTAYSRLRIAVLGCVLFFGLFLLDFGANTRVWELLGDAAHVPIFAATVFGMAWVFAGSVRPLWCALAGAALVLFIEFVQPAFGRSASAVDVMNGLIGVGCGLAASLLFERFGRRFAPGVIVFAVLFAGLGTAWALLPAYSEWQLVEAMRRRLPLIADFEDEESTAFWTALAEKPPEETFFRTTLHARAGRWALKVNTVPMRYSGAELRLEGMSWASHKAFEFAVFVDEPKTLAVRVDDWGDCDAFDARFNRSFSLNAGWNELSIPVEDVRRGPKNRALDVSRLKRVLFFFTPSQKSQSYLIDQIKLS